MLLNEFLKEHKAFLEEQRTVQKLEGIVADLTTAVKKQAAQLQRVDAEIELSKSVTATVATP